MALAEASHSLAVACLWVITNFARFAHAKRVMLVDSSRSRPDQFAAAIRHDGELDIPILRRDSIHLYLPVTSSGVI